MPKSVENTGVSLLVDWLSFSAVFDSWKSAVEFLGLSQYYEQFNECPAYDFYTEGIKFNDIVILRGNKNNLSSYFIELKGRGCRAFEDYSEYSLDEYLIPMIYQMSFKPARIDLALDLQGTKITIETFVKAYNKGYYKCRSKSTTLISSNNDGISGYSLYFGKQGSNTRINIYDKRAERGFDDKVQTWVRFELRLRHENAYGFVKQYCENDYELGYFFSSVVNNYISFLKPSKTDSNKNRWAVAPWWRKLMGTTDKISVFYKPGIEYDYSKFEKDFFLQCGSRVKTYLTMHNIFDLERAINNKDITLNDKQKALISHYIPNIDIII